MALAGDSTVASYKEPGIAGWGQVIGKLFKDNAEIKNFAVGGRSTKTFIAEKRWEKLLESKPQYILLQFGHNDSHGKGKPESTDASTEYKEFLRKYVDDAKNAGAQIIFVSPMHRRTFKNGKLTMELLPYVNAMKEIAKEKDIPFIDLYNSSGTLFESLGDEKSGHLSCKPKDRTHFSPEGADKMAELVVEGLKSCGSDITKYLK
ncbi:MAG: hypothetical protein A2020_13925 [Lentisphaerae bacterium GWF2_45_14]|nr:MAG: hypothetical protein A2020_13925 [Lentisphaerae bacterium GWF2_45_14]